ncbi:MAG: hypothetical protein JW803_03515 [Endomicrobiales bacterium]|nr:hypothetical protein [Endomicrobiales bacterium]
MPFGAEAQEIAAAFVSKEAKEKFLAEHGSDFIGGIVRRIALSVIHATMWAASWPFGEKGLYHANRLTHVAVNTVLSVVGRLYYGAINLVRFGLGKEPIQNTGMALTKWPGWAEKHVVEVKRIDEDTLPYEIKEVDLQKTNVIRKAVKREKIDWQDMGNGYWDTIKKLHETAIRKPKKAGPIMLALAEMMVYMEEREEEYKNDRFYAVWAINEIMVGSAELARSDVMEVFKVAGEQLSIAMKNHGRYPHGHQDLEIYIQHLAGLRENIFALLIGRREGVDEGANKERKALDRQREKERMAVGRWERLNDLDIVRKPDIAEVDLNLLKVTKGTSKRLNAADLDKAFSMDSYWDVIKELDRLTIMKPEDSGSVMLVLAELLRDIGTDYFAIKSQAALTINEILVRAEELFAGDLKNILEIVENQRVVAKKRVGKTDDFYIDTYVGYLDGLRENIVAALNAFEEGQTVKGKPRASGGRGELRAPRPQMRSGRAKAGVDTNKAAVKTRGTGYEAGAIDDRDSLDNVLRQAEEMTNLMDPVYLRTIVYEQRSVLRARKRDELTKQLSSKDELTAAVAGLILIEVFKYDNRHSFNGGLRTDDRVMISRRVDALKKSKNEVARAVALVCDIELKADYYSDFIGGVPIDIELEIKEALKDLILSGNLLARSIARVGLESYQSGIYFNIARKRVFEVINEEMLNIEIAEEKENVSGKKSKTGRKEIRAPRPQMRSGGEKKSEGSAPPAEKREGPKASPAGKAIVPEVQRSINELRYASIYIGYILKGDYSEEIEDMLDSLSLSRDPLVRAMANIALLGFYHGYYRNFTGDRKSQSYDSVGNSLRGLMYSNDDLASAIACLGMLEYYRTRYAYFTGRLVSDSVNDIYRRLAELHPGYDIQGSSFRSTLENIRAAAYKRSDSMLAEQAKSARGKVEAGAVDESASGRVELRAPRPESRFGKLSDRQWLINILVYETGHNNEDNMRRLAKMAIEPRGNDAVIGLSEGLKTGMLNYYYYGPQLGRRILRSIIKVTETRQISRNARRALLSMVREQKFALKDRELYDSKEFRPFIKELEKLERILTGVRQDERVELRAPRVGSTGEGEPVNTAILEAKDNLESGKWRATQAVERIMQAFENMREPEYITELDWAIRTLKERRAEINKDKTIKLRRLSRAGQLYEVITALEYVSTRMSNDHSMLPERMAEIFGREKGGSAVETKQIKAATEVIVNVVPAAKESAGAAEAAGSIADKAMKLRKAATELDGLSYWVKSGIDSREKLEGVLSETLALSKRLNGLVAEDEGNAGLKKKYDALMVAKSLMCRDLAKSMMDLGDADMLAGLKDRAFDMMSEFMDGQCAKDKITREKADEQLKNAKHYIEEWLDPRNEVPDFILQGMYRGMLEGRSADLIFSFEGWKEFGTAGIRNPAFQSSFKAIRDQELKEFDEDGVKPFAPVLTGTMLINPVSLLQQEASVARIMKELRAKVQGNDSSVADLEPEYKRNILNNKIVIAYDSRINGEYYAKLLSAAFIKDGIEVVLFDNAAGVPHLAWAAKKYGAAFGFLISASHSEANCNGFKAFLGHQMSQVDKASKKMIVDARGKVGYPDMHMEFLTQTHKVDKTMKSEGKLTWIGSPKKMSGGYDYMGRPVVKDFYEWYYNQNVKPRSPLRLLDKETRERIEEKRKDLDVLYTAFFGVGAVPAADFPGFMGEAGYSSVDTVESQTNVMDGTFPGHVSPDPGIVQGWISNLLDYFTQYGGENLADIDSAIEALNSKEVGLATDPDIDRAGMMISLPEGVEGNIKEALIKRIKQYIDDNPELGISKRTVIGAMRSRLLDKFLLTANDTWSFMAYWQLKMMEENGKLSKDTVYVIEKSHVTTSALERVAKLYRDKGYKVYVVDTYVGFTEIGKKGRDLFSIAGLSWKMHKALTTGGMSYARDLLKEMQKANAELKQGVPYQTAGMPLIEETMTLLEKYLAGDDAAKAGALKNLDALSKMHILAGVEESNGYGELGRWDREKGKAVDNHISDKDGSLAAFKFAELLVYGKSLESPKSGYQMYLELVKDIGMVNTVNSALLHPGLTGEADRINEVEGIEKVLAYEVQKRLDMGQKVKLFNGKYTVNKVEVFRDGKYDTKYLGFSEEGIRFYVTTKSGSEGIVTYRPSGTGDSNRVYSWLMGVKPKEGEDLEKYRAGIEKEMEHVVVDFYGVEGKESGYAELGKGDFKGLLMAVKEAGVSGQMRVFGKAIGEDEIGFTHEERALYEAVKAFAAASKDKGDGKNIPETRAANRAAWEAYLNGDEVREMPDTAKYDFVVEGKLAARIPKAAMIAWQAGLVDYMIGLMEATGKDKVEISFSDAEVMDLIRKRFGGEVTEAGKPELPPIQVGSTGEYQPFNQAILEADSRMQTGEWTAKEAAGHVYEAFANCKAPEYVGNLETAVSILSYARKSGDSDTMHHLLLSILRKYRDEKIDHVPMFAEVQELMEAAAGPKTDDTGKYVRILESFGFKGLVTGQVVREFLEEMFGTLNGRDLIKKIAPELYGKTYVLSSVVFSQEMYERAVTLANLGIKVILVMPASPDMKGRMSNFSRRFSKASLDRGFADVFMGVEGTKNGSFITVSLEKSGNEPLISPEKHAAAAIKVLADNAPSIGQFGAIDWSSFRVDVLETDSVLSHPFAVDGAAWPVFEGTALVLRGSGVTASVPAAGIKEQDARKALVSDFEETVKARFDSFIEEEDDTYAAVKMAEAALKRKKAGKAVKTEPLASVTFDMNNFDGGLGRVSSPGYLESVKEKGIDTIVFRALPETLTDSVKALFEGIVRKAHGLGIRVVVDVSYDALKGNADNAGYFPGLGADGIRVDMSGAKLTDASANAEILKIRNALSRAGRDLMMAVFMPKGTVSDASFLKSVDVREAVALDPTVNLKYTVVPPAAWVELSAVTDRGVVEYADTARFKKDVTDIMEFEEVSMLGLSAGLLDQVERRINESEMETFAEFFRKLLESKRARLMADPQYRFEAERKYALSLDEKELPKLGKEAIDGIYSAVENFRMWSDNGDAMLEFFRTMKRYMPEDRVVDSLCDDMLQDRGLRMYACAGYAQGILERTEARANERPGEPFTYESDRELYGWALVQQKLNSQRAAAPRQQTAATAELSSNGVRISFNIAKLAEAVHRGATLPEIQPMFRETIVMLKAEASGADNQQRYMSLTELLKLMDLYAERDIKVFRVIKRGTSEAMPAAVRAIRGAA